jgi:hypothetical protein
VEIGTDFRLTLPARWAEVEVAIKEGPDKGKTEIEIQPAIWAFHTPISREVFESSYRLISGVNELLTAGNGGYSRSGPAIATLTLRDVARRDAAEWGSGSPNDPGGAGAFLESIKQATMILAPSPEGFRYLPVDVALQQNTISADEWREVEAALVFFTCAYSMLPAVTRRSVSIYLASALRGSITSLTLTEFAASLQTSTPAATSETPAAEESSLPS